MRVALGVRDDVGVCVAVSDGVRVDVPVLEAVGVRVGDEVRSGVVVSVCVGVTLGE